MSKYVTFSKYQSNMINYISRSLFFCENLASMRKVVSLITVFLFVFTLTLSFPDRTISKFCFTENDNHTWKKIKKKNRSPILVQKLVIPT
jgi:hypothetical protein